MQKQKLVHHRLSALYAAGKLTNLRSYNCIVRLYWDTYEPELPSYEQVSAETITRAFRRLVHGGHFQLGTTFEKKRQDIAEQYRAFYEGREPDPIVFTGPDYAMELGELDDRTSTTITIYTGPRESVPSHLGGIHFED